MRTPGGDQASPASGCGRPTTTVGSPQRRLDHPPRDHLVPEPSRDWGATAIGYFSPLFSDRGWMRGLDLEVGGNRGGGRRAVHGRPRDQPARNLRDIAGLRLTLAETKLVLAGVQRGIAAEQARDHAVRRPGCQRCSAACRVRNYQNHAVSTLFGRVIGPRSPG